MVRIGIVGLGFMGMIHFLAARKATGARVTAICSRDPKKLSGDWTSIRGNFGPPGEHVDLTGIKTYNSLDAMLADPEIDLIDICNPTQSHPATAIAALKAGKHVLVEKAIALTTSEADTMPMKVPSASKTGIPNVKIGRWMIGETRMPMDGWCVWRAASKMGSPRVRNRKSWRSRGI